MSDCKQCPYTVGDSYQRDCAFPDCVGGWEEAYKSVVAERDVYKKALESISKNTCCDSCQEAALVAKQALSKYAEKRGE